MFLRILTVLLVFVLAGCKPTGSSSLESGAIDNANSESGSDSRNDAGCHSETNNDAKAYFTENVYSILQSECMDCHVKGGIAGYTSFTLSADPDVDYQQVKALLERKVSGYPYLLMKATGFAGHTGGAQFEFESAQADALRRLEMLLGTQHQSQNCEQDEADNGVIDEPEKSDFFDGISFLSDEETLDKAAMIMLGRRATPKELGAVRGGSIETLKTAVRALMEGPHFTKFLMLGANDQLLTNAFTNDRTRSSFVSPDHDTSYYRFHEIDWPGIMPQAALVQDELYNEALAREPLALIAYIVNNERDYREVLTANYTVFNARTYEFFDYHQSGFVQLFDPDTGAPVAPPVSDAQWIPGRFAPGVGTGYYVDETKTRHSEAIEYPHSGVLTTMPWLARWPNTNTNGQRKRAKMLLKQFLAFDIESSTTRPMNMEELEDSSNPTFNNPACTSCHVTLDSLAGAFQNWGHKGRFRLNDNYFVSGRRYLRENALNDGYMERTRNHCGRPLGIGGYCEGDLWYADRFPIGLVMSGEQHVTLMPDDGPGSEGPFDQATLRWLTKQIVRDSRFVTGTVKFWYPMVFGRRPLATPAGGEMLGTGQFPAYVEEQAFLDRLGTVFSSDNGNGRFNLKDLLVEMFVSNWFRATSTLSDGLSGPPKIGVGMGVPLTPEQLSRKVEGTTGVKWHGPNGDDLLVEKFNVIYGGIDSETVTERNREFNPVALSVVHRMAAEVSCETVYVEFIGPRSVHLSPAEDPMILRAPRYRRLFMSYGGEGSADEVAVKKTLADLHRILWGQHVSPSSLEVAESFDLFEVFSSYERDSDEVMRCASNPGREVVPSNVEEGSGYSPEILRAWRDMLMYFLTDPNFLTE